MLFFRARKLLRPTIMNFATKRAVIKFNGFTMLHWFHTLSLTQISYYRKRWNLPSLLEWNIVVMWKVNSNIHALWIMILFCHKASPESKGDWWKCNASEASTRCSPRGWSSLMTFSKPLLKNLRISTNLFKLGLDYFCVALLLTQNFLLFVSLDVCDWKWHL